MEDKEVKRRLRRVPDVDKDGEPIWKIERGADKADGKGRSNVLKFPAKDRDRKKP
jgi:hypothetical protein